MTLRYGRHSLLCLGTLEGRVDGVGLAAGLCFGFGLAIGTAAARHLLRA